MKQLSTKIFFGYVLIIIVLTGLILTFSFQTTKNHYIETFQKDLTNLNITLIPRLIPLLNDTNNTELNYLVKNLGSKINTRITIIDTNGVVLADSEFEANKMENHLNRPEIEEALTFRTIGSSNRFSTTLNDKMIYLALPIFKDSTLIGVSRVSLFLSEITELNNRLSYEIIQISLIVIFISFFGVLYFSRRVTKPINELSHASRKVALGDFRVKVNFKGRDEIKDLGNNFNDMTDRLSELFEQVLSQKEEYHTLISSIQEGMVVVDADGKITLSNDSFKNLIGRTELKGLKYYEIEELKPVSEVVDSLLTRNEISTKEVNINGKDFFCSGSFIGSKKEVVMLFHDVTEQKRLEKIKKDFVTNVSHELKTPLTAIKGFVETLQDDIEDDQSAHYLDIIMRHTNRLIAIVQDLLILSEMEDSPKLMISKVDIKKICENVIKIFEQKVKPKNIALDLNIEEDFPKLSVDIFRFEQILVNLIDNAIKYTDEGGIFINIFQEFDKAIIEVQDTGVGISEEDQQRIFERFYITDKSRSRKTGGSGLGLAIVKHIVQLHEGSINIESSKGKGTKFIIQLPLNSNVSTK